MTTSVIVRAKHGWAVDVTSVDTATRNPEWTQQVAAGEEREFHVHSGSDLLVHEVQPDQTS
ncbi:hypothetical protein [Puniceibacterium sp. IMCC21224]|uniref:hypothetical protein n=1 Tax=Puniceibacterium sp. IMCC21224 TaxID=1618204 RepID=UPI00064DDAC4|nr:hypothetical protein [Puniceibacterium sp. IMCC21224]KMK68577.1 hypothetical protein IMCC21224_113460 [Puniceibacterium sp. IMCC21224]